MTTVELTAERLRELLAYDASTGVFTNRIKRGSRAMPGTAAGCSSGRGYIHIELDGRRYPAHRLAWLYAQGHWPVGEIDHIDRNRANNRISNLRDATRAINMQNRAPRKGTRSGHRGVTRNGRGWQARICIDGRYLHLGQFNCPNVAAQLAHLARIRFCPGYPPRAIFLRHPVYLGPQPGAPMGL